MLGLVDALRFGDGAAVKGGAADPHRESYLAIFRQFAQRLVDAQGDDGAWRSSILQSSLFPTPETSSTACFTHGLAYGVNARLLDGRVYAPAVRKAWNFLAHTALSSLAATIEEMRSAVHAHSRSSSASIGSGGGVVELAASEGAAADVMEEFDSDESF